MARQVWLNLPVKDVARSREFFSKIGFSFNASHGAGEDSACMLVGDNGFVVMLFAEETFRGIVRGDVSDAARASEMLISVDAASREEVDQMASRAFDAGGTVFGAPAEVQGWMYGCGFADPDGHRWNVLFMDMSKVPGQPAG